MNGQVYHMVIIQCPECLAEVPVAFCFIFTLVWDKNNLPRADVTNHVKAANHNCKA